MEFIIMSIKIIGTLIVFILLMLLALRLNEGKLKEINGRKMVRVVERTQLSKDVSLQIIKISGKGYIMSVSASKAELIKELSEDEIKEIEISKQIEIQKNNEAFNTMIKPFETVLNRIKKRKKEDEK